MKLMAASDIHGSRLWCEKMLEAFRSEGADKLLLLGDLLYHGPRNPLPEGHDPKGVAALLNGVKDKLICVRGNCDSEVDQMVLDFPIMAEYAWICADGAEVFAAHGHNFSPKNPPAIQGGFLLNGHTHIPMIREEAGYTYVNCGSVALPKEDSPHSYAVLENGKFTLKNL